MGEVALRAGDIAATRRSWEEAWHWAPPDEPVLVEALLERLPKVREEGDYFRSLALAQRACAAGQRTFGVKTEATCAASYYNSVALMLCGRVAEALDAADRLLRHSN